MGAVNSSNVLSKTIRNHRSSDVFYPHSSYKPFPPHRNRAVRCTGRIDSRNRGCSKIIITDTTPSDEGYWYVEASFLPYDDARIIVSASCYNMLAQHQAGTSPISSIPRGRIFIVDLSKYELDYYKIKGTSTSTKPKLSIHPSAKFIGFLGVGEVNLVALDSTQVYTKQKDITNASFRCLAIAPNGINIAILTHSQGRFEIKLSSLIYLQSYSVTCVPCHTLCPEFRSQRFVSTCVELKWSPDSLYLAVSCDVGVLFILQVATMTNVCTVFDEVIEGRLSSNKGYDFSPQYNHAIMAVATAEEVKVHIINIIAGVMMSVLEPCYGDQQNNDVVECVKYNPDGQSIAISLHSLKIVVMCVKQGCKLLTIDVNAYYSGTVMGFDLHDVNILAIDYSTDGQKLLTACCDGIIRVWNIGNQVQALMALCRLKLLSLIQVSKVKSMALPSKIKDYLLRTQCAFE